MKMVIYMTFLMSMTFLMTAVLFSIIAKVIRIKEMIL